MEAVGAAASTIALVGVVLKSVKTIHETISAVKDGPKIVQDLADQVHELEGILNRVSTISQSTTTRNATDTAALATAVIKCKGDMSDVESKLQRLQLSPTDRRSGRIWKRAKQVIGEKDLEQLRQVIQGHINRLSLRLDIMTVEHMVVSESQQSQMLSLLKQILAAVDSPSPKDASPTSVPTCATEPLGLSPSSGAAAEEEAAEPLKLEPQTSPSLNESIARLTGLVTEKECTVESEDASQLIEDLKLLLEAANQSEQSHEQSIRKEVELAKTLILSAPATAINRLAFEPPPIFPIGTIITQDRRRKTISLRDGELVLYTNTKRRKRRLVGQPESESKERDFEFKITFRPSAQQKTISLLLKQGQFGSYTMASIPRLWINNILPEDSEIFSAAANGKPEDIMALIQEGKGSLRDHDTHGWSLLHWATYAGNLPVVRFLLQNGLDPEEWAFEDDGDIQTPFTVATDGALLAVWRNEKSEIGSETILSALLKAGGDPYLQYEHNINLSLRWKTKLSYDFLLTLNMTLRISPHLFNPSAEQDPETGNTLFLTIWDVDCEYLQYGLYSYNNHLETLSLLLKCGSEVSERNRFGETCLHVLFSSSDLDVTIGCKLIPSLIYVIQEGANVDAKSGRGGHSVSELAYGWPCTHYWRADGSYRGDLRDLVLDACGYRIRDFRIKEGIQRIAKYTKYYTRKDFELLWKGREERCPYWDDEPWPPLSEMKVSREPGAFVHVCYGIRRCEWRESRCRIESRGRIEEGEEEEDDYEMDSEISSEPEQPAESDGEDASGSDSDDGGVDLM